MKEIRLQSPAKINWWLRVGPPREDGFHDLETVYQELAFADQITVRQRQDDQCVLSGFPPDIDPASNLVTKAWHACKNAFPGRVSGIDIRIEKILPRGGGLGGGSSNAATVIRTISDIFELGDPASAAHLTKLYEIAATIGSDVPFFITGGTALGTGRGEMISALPPTPRYWLVLIFPPKSMPTADAYHLLDKTQRPFLQGEADADLEKFLQILSSGDPAAVAPSIINDFELVAVRFPWFQDAARQLQSAGALRAFLCGSGSTVAGLCADEQHALQIAANLPDSVITYTM